MQTRSALILIATDLADPEKDQELLWTPIAGRSSVARILSTCEAAPAPDFIIILINSAFLTRAQALVEELGLKKVTGILPTDQNRLTALSSALAALKTNAPDTREVAIHAAHYPLITVELLLTGFAAARQYQAVSAAVPVKETIKLVEQGTIQATLDRSALWQLQSPQIFALDLLDAALQTPEALAGFPDEATLLTRLGKTVTIFPGSYNNLRLCGPADLLLAEALLQG